MIDWRRVQELLGEIGPECFEEIVAIFLQETDEVIARLRALSDTGSVESDLHFLKGSALNLGFAELAQICQTGERRAATGFDDVTLDAVIDIYHQSRAAFLGGIKTLAA
ncbi:Hpt domain-containing protein [Pseudotabrizicola alkalilacus]|uniref:Hpt domain-containing protein n=1 Tax=Pseudotabrizicola alkalilacus TaxID=2305252 RepID=A0A411Z3G0_9RHOB|nr:Hpt domain-containing protein [Pseudotabrizicola alkalilacus]RGP37599.1 Hpt domain-containing protein [Pseudotabrizicola alkalilacus]